MRAIWWIFLSFGILIVSGNLSDQAAAYNRRMGSPVFGVGLFLFILIWSMIVSQVTFTRINRTIGYLLFYIGLALSIFLAGAALAMYLDVVNAESGDRTPGSIAFFGSIFIAAGFLLWSIVMIVSKQHVRTLPWGILETHKIVGADPAYGQAQSAASDANAS